MAALGLAIVVAPVTTALCFSLAIVWEDAPGMSWADILGGTLTYLFLALIFGTIIAAIPSFLLGGIAILVARRIGTRSPVYFIGVGLFAGMVMAWLDAARSSTAPTLAASIPFVLSGCVSALIYWRLAEREAPAERVV